MRAFLCVPLEASVKRVIAQAAEALRSSTQMRASWVRAENYHLTVRFLGEIDPKSTVSLDRLIDEVAREHPPFQLTLNRVGVFPAFSNPRVLWVGGASSSSFVDLVQETNTGLETVGFEPERRRPTSHVTMARIKGQPDPTLERTVEGLNPLGPIEVAVDRIVLMESRLTPSGATYVPVFEKALGGTR